ncbi:MAG TPA: class I poly(R)-hydroxyalkanoic acid synthase [Burkholderiales bacterium]|nr:class I poly(R)-hydroxyalkanoic acid synthase [Burkholderiales bacterium]
MTSSSQPPASRQGDFLQEMARANASFVESMFRGAPIPLTGDVDVLTRAFATAEPKQLERLGALQEQFYRDHAALWQRIVAEGSATPAPDQDDARFEAPEWRLPFFQYLRHAYLINARFLRDLGELATLDPHAKRRLQYQLRQVADALSPGNYAATNPEVIKLAAQSGGESLALGAKLLAGDVARGRISMTDETAFEVGRNLATTPGAVVFENEIVQLIQYAPSTPDVHALPLLIVPPFINKYYILDLQPDNSFVRFCVAQGFRTFIVSWRNIPPELGALGWDDYIEQGVLAPLAAIKSITQADRVNALGFCVGGTLLSCALAAMAANGDESAASLTLLATLLDFSETGDISVYVDREFIERSEREFAQPAAMSGSKLANTFAMLRANDLIWHFVINSYLKGRPPRAFDLLYWNSDGANLPGRLYAWYLRNMYLENNLKTPGRLKACGVALDLGDVDLPAYIVATRDDHIVPWRSAYASIGLLGGETQFVLGASGHVAGIVNPASKNRRHFWVDGAAGSDADAWLAGATQRPGSWWSHWAQWLASRSGARVPAVTQLGNAQYPAIEPAPGRYVKEKSS